MSDNDFKELLQRYVNHKYDEVIDSINDIFEDVMTESESSAELLLNLYADAKILKLLDELNSLIKRG